MLLLLRPNPSPAAVESVFAAARALGLEASLVDRGRRVCELAGEAGPEARSRFEDLGAVERVVSTAGARERHERGGREDRVVRIAEAAFGGGCVSLIAGPCAVEGEERLLAVARAVRQAGGALLRGGAFKPRTNPHSFQGLGDDGLRMLARAREETGLGVVTEVLDPRDVERVAEVADAFQIGARSMANSALLREVGRTGRPVILKRGLAATVREFLLAAEHVLDEGNEDVVLCERGVRSFDTVTRNLLDLGAVAHLKLATHLPVVVDPSHAAGRADLVRPLARAGIAAGADGLLVETHPAPHEARSDGAQAVSFDQLRQIAADTGALLDLDGRILFAPNHALAAPSA